MSGLDTVPDDIEAAWGTRVGVGGRRAARVGRVERGRRVLMEYVGRTALVVTGPYTGERYRFDQPGSRLSVDPRDQQSMLSLPMLRSVAI